MMKGNNTLQPFSILFSIRRNQVRQEKDRIKVEINVKIKYFLLKITCLKKKTLYFQLNSPLYPGRLSFTQRMLVSNNFLLVKVKCLFFLILKV